MLETYGKELELKLKTTFDTKASTKEFKKEIDELQKSISWMSEEDVKVFTKNYKKQQKLLSDIQVLKGEINNVAMFSNDDELLRDLQKKLKALNKEKEFFERDSEKRIKSTAPTTALKDSFSLFTEEFRKVFEDKKTIKDAGDLGEALANKAVDGINKGFDKIKRFFTDLFDKAIEEMQNIASFDIFGSRQYSAKANQMYMQYGLQGEDAYAVNKALSEKGLDLETLLTDPVVQSNEALLADIRKDYELAKETYANDLEVAKQFETFQDEYTDFKKELQQDVIDFFMENKDTIMWFMETSIDFLGGILDVVDWIAGIFGQNRERSKASRENDARDILRQGLSNEVMSSNISTTNNTNNQRTSNVKIDNTFNGVGKSDQTWLANTSQMTYQQVIKALTEGGI